MKQMELYEDAIFAIDARIMRFKEEADNGSSFAEHQLWVWSTVLKGIDERNLGRDKIVAIHERCKQEIKGLLSDVRMDDERRERELAEAEAIRKYFRKLLHRSLNRN